MGLPNRLGLIALSSQNPREYKRNRAMSPTSTGLPNRVGLMAFSTETPREYEGNRAMSPTSMGLPNRVGLIAFSTESPTQYAEAGHESNIPWGSQTDLDSWRLV